MHADELVRAVRAALDDTERIANEALSHPTRWHGAVGERTGTDDGVWRAGSGMDECRVEGIGITIYDEGGHSAEQARHIARHDPAAVLRQVAADRRVLERHQPEFDVCAYCLVVAWPCPDFADLAHGLGINPEETP